MEWQGMEIETIHAWMTSNLDKTKYPRKDYLTKMFILFPLLGLLGSKYNQTFSLRLRLQKNNGYTRLHWLRIQAPGVAHMQLVLHTSDWCCRVVDQLHRVHHAFHMH